MKKIKQIIYCTLDTVGMYLMIAIVVISILANIYDLVTNLNS